MAIRGISKIPVETLLSKEHARQRAALIDPRRANGQVAAAKINASDTTYLTVVDREGNIASWIQSVYSNFGSGITVEGMGFTLQNRGAGFTLDPTHPNVLAGGKRPYHTIIPGFMQRGERAASDSASWAVPISRWPTPSLFRTSSITE